MQIYTHTYTQSIHEKQGLPRFVERPVEKKKSFELSFEVREGGQFVQTGRQQTRDRWSDQTERTLADRFQIVFRDFQRLLD